MKRFTPPQTWHQEYLQSGAFSHLNTLFNLNCFQAWPSIAQLNAFCLNGESAPVTFVDNETFAADGRYYESFIHATAQVPTRHPNWHDLFGALIWHLFPKTKRLLNELHIQDIKEFGTEKRTKRRNALTLFDECVVILAITDEQWSDEFRNHNWHEVFVNKRHLWGKEIAPFCLGHANYEMLTQPFIGLTGKAFFVKVDADIFCKDLVSQYRYLDEQLCAMITEQNLLADNTAMSPLPLLGVPGWHQQNEDETFYDNTDYFRPKRRK